MKNSPKARKKKYYKKSKKGSPAPKAAPPPKKKESSILPKISENSWMLVLTFLASISYIVYSVFSDGFYQHDEAAHFISMKSFWHDPNVILGTWAKPGYKLIYAIPSLLGEKAVLVLNTLFIGFSAFLVYKVLKQMKSSMAILGFFILAAQPLWIQLAFRNYSEIPTAFLLILTVFLHNEKKYLWSTFVLSYLCLIRQELYLFLAMYGVFLLVKKQFKPILFACIPQVFISLWGLVADGDILYIFNSVFNSSAAYGKAYPRQGFFHYMELSEVIFGVVTLVGIFAYLGERVLNRKLPHFAVLAPALLFFLLHCIFNSKTLEIGPASGGNLRYMVIVSPLLAVLSGYAIGQIKNMKKAYRMLFFIVPAVVLIGYFQTYENNLIKLTTVRDWSPLIRASIAGAFVVFAVKLLSNRIATLVLSTLAILFSAFTLKPYPLSPEDKTVKEAVEWYEEQVAQSPENSFVQDSSQLVVAHALFFYYQGRTRYDFDKQVLRPREQSLPEIKEGSVIFWDSHYSHRPKLDSFSLPLQYFLNRPQEYSLLKSLKADKKTFNIQIFKKTGPRSATYDQALKEFNAKNYEKALELFDQTLQSDNQNFAAYMFGGACYQNLQKYNEAFQYYTLAIQLNENYDQSYLYRANLLSSFPEHQQQALEDFNKAISLNPTDYRSLYFRGNHFFRLKKWKEAERDFIASLQINQRNPQGFYYLAMAQINQGEKEKGCQNLNNAKTLGDSNADKAIEQHCK